MSYKNSFAANRKLKRGVWLTALMYSKSHQTVQITNNPLFVHSPDKYSVVWHYTMGILCAKSHQTVELAHKLFLMIDKLYVLVKHSLSL